MIKGMWCYVIQLTNIWFISFHYKNKIKTSGNVLQILNVNVKQLNWMWNKELLWNILFDKQKKKKSLIKGIYKIYFF